MTCAPYNIAHLGEEGVVSAASAYKLTVKSGSHTKTFKKSCVVRPVPNMDGEIEWVREKRHYPRKGNRVTYDNKYVTTAEPKSLDITLYPYRYVIREGNVPSGSPLDNTPEPTYYVKWQGYNYFKLDWSKYPVYDRGCFARIFQQYNPILMRWEDVRVMPPVLENIEENE